MRAISDTGAKLGQAAPSHSILDKDAYAALLAALRGNERLSLIVSQRLSELDGWETERAEWQQERRLLRAMIDQVPDYLFVKDTECRFVIANRAVAADLGFDPDAILGKTDLELHTYELARQFYDVDLQVIRSGEPLLDREEYVVLPTGEKRWLSTSKLPLRDDAGTIIGLVGIARDITRRKVAEDELHRLAYHDQLTGLLNRASLEAELRQAQSSSPLSHLLLIDLDRFKRVNDTLGHSAGDALLRQTGAVISEVIGAAGKVFRIGGDEFAAIVCGVPDLAALCEDIVRRLDTAFLVEGKLAHIGASVGVAPLDRVTDKPMDGLREADIALYESKGQGRGQWRLFEPHMATSIGRRHRLELDLHEAVRSNDQIYAVFQPIYSVDRRQILGAEALARWRHPQDGVLSPATFIQIAESIGLIGAIGDRMLRSACELLSGSKLPWVAVNVSPIQLHSSDFADELRSTVARYAVSPHRLQLEITESVLLEEGENTAALLSALQQDGFRIALDDFGTGYSSLNYLSRFPIDKVKIDRSFVSAIGTKGADAIVRAIVSLAKGLDLSVTAEGVETEQQRRYLEEVGCPEIQGYLVGHPMPREQFEGRSA